MFVGRNAEIEYLNKIFNQNTGALVTMYGVPGVGCTSVWREFVKDKKFVYIKCPKAGLRQINYLVSKDLSLKGFRFDSDFPEFDVILDTVSNKYKVEKFVLVIDDFENAFKADDSYIESIFSHLKINKYDNRFMILLASHDTRYVENTFVEKIGKNALSISGFLKIHPVSFLDMVMFHDTDDTAKCMDFYALLGGNVAFYSEFDINASIKENIVNNFLLNNGVFRSVGTDVLLEHLREVNVYGTILYCLANGYTKLNDIFVHTGFSRAKISVYLKNLMSLDIVEKVASFDTPGSDNTMKGIYRISNPIVHFWYRFVYPHESFLSVLTPDNYYDMFIKDNLDDFLKQSIPLICREYLELLNKKGKLPIEVVKSGEWIGKAGTIHYIGKDSRRNVICAYCSLGNEAMDLSEYEWFDYCMKEAGIRADYQYLFAKSGFSDDLRENLSDKDIYFIDICNL